MIEKGKLTVNCEEHEEFKLDKEVVEMCTRCLWPQGTLGLIATRGENHIGRGRQSYIPEFQGVLAKFQVDLG